MGTARINNQQLIDFAAGNLSGELASQFAAQIANDRDVLATVERYRLAAATMAADDSVEPPASIVAQAKSIFKPIAQSAPSLGAAIREVIARVLYDSRLQLAAVRTTDTQRRVQLTYATDDVEIELQAERDLSTTGGEWRVMGQVAGDVQVGRVTVTIAPAGKDEAVFETTIEGDETFSVKLSSGKYVMRAALNGVVVVVPEVVLE